MEPHLVSIGSEPVSRLFNRELSLLAFHERVLALAMDPGIPLLERLRFLCISSTNLDEFFEIRVARLKHAIELGADKPQRDGLSAARLLENIHARASRLVERQYDAYGKHLSPALAAEGIVLARRASWSAGQTQWLRGYFCDNILPVLSPLGLDPARPFPHIINKSLNFIVGIEGEDALQRSSRYAVVQAPRSLPRLIRLPEVVAEGAETFVFLASLIRAFAADVFPGMEVSACHQFRVTRNSDLFLDGEDFDDLLIALSDRLADRRHAAVVRMETSVRCSADYEEFLRAHFGLSSQDCYRVDGPVNLNRLLTLYALLDRPDLKYPPFRAGTATPAKAMFTQLRDRDRLLHHPYESFAPVIAFLREAARDPKVLAIKQTLYRTGPDSSVVDALVEAAQNGKEVTVVIELRARFDEADNIALANRLQEAGVHVVYGVVGFKTHAKMLLVVRSEERGLIRYVHLGTGNYHPRTAKAYTDYSLFTAHKDICSDVHEIFLQLTGLSKQPALKQLLLAPFDLHAALTEKIERETAVAEDGRPARLIAKVNSLVEPRIIEALYAASAAGVQIELVVRGVCCLRPQVEGLSENIRVRSILGRFLEHSRIYYFANDGDGEVYLSSADWMDRNFFRRIEVGTPVLNEELKTRIIADLERHLADEAGTWHLDSDGVYRRAIGYDRGSAPCAQEQLLAMHTVE